MLDPGVEGWGGDDAPGTSSSHRGWDKAAYLERKKDMDALEATIRQTYDELTGEDATFAVLAQVDGIVRTKRKPLKIDLKALAGDEQRTLRLMRLWDEEMALRAAIEEEDELILLLA